MNIGFIGLGEMGTNIAANLVKSNFKISVYNRTLDKAKKFAKKFKCNYENNIEALCKNKKIIVLCLSTDTVVKKITDKIFKCISPNTIIIDHSTIDFNVSRKIFYKAKKNKTGYIDAPITGGPIRAKQGRLGIMVGGNYLDFKKIKKILQSYSEICEYMGPSGQGQLTKITNLMISFNIKQGLIEGIRFANAFGIDRKKLLKVLLNGSSNSFQATKHADNILKNRLEERIITPLTRKDARIALKNIKKKKLRLHCTELFAKIINK
jgi:3-hydroxyisobutyrate dehydrogenase-like beta-hydroxyacid dehydrogenase